LYSAIEAKKIGGAAVALAACHRLKILEAARSTLAALIITLLNTNASSHWEAAATRVAAVVAGCVIAMAVTWFFHSVLKFSFGEEAENASAKAAGG
jgi:uncharacterized membrane protein YccC